jgi:predicted nuclease of restriction endonuclease-like RecB superfamily
MKLALADVKKRVVRREGEAYLVPQLLRRGDLAGELAALVALFEELVGRPRECSPDDRPAEIVGDYRLARGLVAVLGDWYAWEPRVWPGSASAEEAAALDAVHIASSSQLRLALYDAVQREAGGFLPAASREGFLDEFAAGLRVRRETLDALMDLDADSHAILRRVAQSPPTPSVLGERYNWRAVEAMLSAAALVTWVLPPAFAAAMGTTLGTLLKRICFLARRMGVYYDAEYASPSVSTREEGRDDYARVAERGAPYAAERPTPTAEERLGPICVTLYGPQEAFGGPTRYGDRLAHLCRTILGMNRPEGGTTSAPVGMRGDALVYLRSQPFHFALDERLLKLILPSSADDAAEAPSAPLAFDSDLERQLFEEFGALEHEQASHGWHLEREPEPVLTGQTVFIPDFTLSRGERRLYLEIAGYWSPGYRERKCRKLLAVAGQIDLLVAAPEEAREAFRALDGVVPCVWYAARPSARQLLASVAEHWDDFAQRRAAISPANVLADVARRGVMPITELRFALGVHDRMELAQVVADVAAAAQRAGSAQPVLVEGLGLASAEWLARLHALVGRVVNASAEGIALSELASELVAQAPELGGAPDREQAVEALAVAAGFVIDRGDLFRPVVRVPGGATDAATSQAESGAQRRRRSAQPRAAPRRTLNEGTHAIPIPWEDARG